MPMWLIVALAILFGWLVLPKIQEFVKAAKS